MNQYHQKVILINNLKNKNKKKFQILTKTNIKKINSNACQLFWLKRKQSVKMQIKQFCVLLFLKKKAYF